MGETLRFTLVDWPLPLFSMHETSSAKNSLPWSLSNIGSGFETSDAAVSDELDRRRLDIPDSSESPNLFLTKDFPDWFSSESLRRLLEIEAFFDRFRFPPAASSSGTVA